MRLNKLIRATYRFLFYSGYRFKILASLGLYNGLSDEKFCEKSYRAVTGKKLNLESPKLFNEKLQWLKLYYRNDLLTTMVDKNEVRHYISEKIGEQYLVPILGVWQNAEKIDFEKMPDKFVLKCNHNSGLGMCVCTDKSKLDIEHTKKQLEKGLAENHYLGQREWPYKNVKPLIIAEKFMESSDGMGLFDYKFYCFNGVPKFLYLGFADIVDNVKHDKMTFLTLDWNKAPFYRMDHEELTNLPPKPKCFDEMISVAKKLSEQLPFVRVDLYSINNKVYFSELTLTPGAGLGVFYPEEWEAKIGEWLHLTK